MPAERPPRTPQPSELGAAGPDEVASGTLNGLWPRVYDDLKRLAHRRLASERMGHTLSTTALVHEVYLRLQAQRVLEHADLSSLFMHAARAMRRVLVDYARRHRALRRGGTQARVALDVVDVDGALTSAQVAAGERADELLALDEALERLAKLDARPAQVVEFRFFAGLTEEETAAALGVTPRTVARDWVKARAWLRLALEEAGSDVD